MKFSNRRQHLKVPAKEQRELIKQVQRAISSLMYNDTLEREKRANLVLELTNYALNK